MYTRRKQGAEAFPCKQGGCRLGQVKEKEKEGREARQREEEKIPSGSKGGSGGSRSPDLDSEPGRGHRVGQVALQ